MASSSIQCCTIDNIKWHPFAPGHAIKDSIAILFINTKSHKSLINNYQNILSKEEINKSYSYQLAFKKEHYLVSRCLIKILLGVYLDRSYNTIQLLPGNTGKPKVSNQSTLHYSVSYSADYMLLAIATDEVGVDIECIRHDFHFQEIVDFSFHSCEQDFIRQHADPSRSFFTLWTRKEALVKATSKGIDDDFNTIPSLDGFHLIDQANLHTSIDWTTSSFTIGTDCIGAISCPSGFTSKDISFYTVDIIPSVLNNSSSQPSHK
ncbi:4'-phosphopantetheinyl transferase family protein [Hymenobacter volaticus]|uniref:4'-phosphopantetheinyl transferase superfamily protein n=1 Tax=Hymenobacter volaticus TaxID=2932254 RepID=A0ABY4G9T6_9BACT|nr:4'-phosphopantetheinyl transferase superfamily protein [Hymenobacter volaticus]UOQ67622.1 4'-phosphopantetheinyl transferase superfamily protein [Hymenobacter volaticus]